MLISMCQWSNLDKNKILETNITVKFSVFVYKFFNISQKFDIIYRYIYTLKLLQILE